MKNSFHFFVFSCFIFLGYSCSSEDNTLNSSLDTELHEVTFNISSFSSEISDMSTKSTLVDSKVKYLRYVVLNKDVTYSPVVEEKTLEGTDLTSPLRLKLRKGNYKICFFASEKPIVSERIKASQSMLGGNTNYIDVVAVKDLSNPNQFHASLDLQVADADIQQRVELKRPIGKITLAISDLDKAPSTVQTLIPILVLSDNNSKYGYVHIAPSYIVMNSGASTFEGQAFPDTRLVYPSIYIDRSKFSTINETTPFNFYLPQTTNIDYEAAPTPFSNRRYDLYLQGVKTDKMEYQNINFIENPELLTDPEFINTPNLLNPNIVFMTCVKKGITIKPNEQIIIKGSLFKGNQLSVILNNTWEETINNSF